MLNLLLFTYVLGTGFAQESCSDVCDQYSVSWSCECDTDCLERGDCCDDYTDVCDSDSASESDDLRGLLEDKWSVFDTKLDEKFDDPVSNSLRLLWKQHLFTYVYVDILVMIVTFVVLLLLIFYLPSVMILLFMLCHCFIFWIYSYYYYEHNYSFGQFVISKQYELFGFIFLSIINMIFCMKYLYYIFWKKSDFYMKMIRFVNNFLLLLCITMLLSITISYDLIVIYIMILCTLIISKTNRFNLTETNRVEEDNMLPV